MPQTDLETNRVDKDDKKKADEERIRRLRQAGLLTGIPYYLLAPIIVGMGLGWWADKKFHTDPWLLMLGVMLGIAAGFREVFNLLKRTK